MGVRIAVLLLLAIAVCGVANAKKEHFDPGARLGITVLSVPVGLADVFGAPEVEGLYVVGPKAEAPIMDGDIVTAIDGRPIATIEALRDVLRSKKAGEIVKVSVTSGGIKSTVSIELEEDLREIYLPSAVCAVPTTGTLFSMDAGPMVLFGFSVVGLGPGDLAGRCGAPIDACRPMRVVKQTADKTVIDLNDLNFEVKGDWRRHTHLDAGTCEQERAQIERATAERLHRDLSMAPSR